MAKFRRSKDEINAELAEHVQALRASCEAYDNGKEWEAKRIAAEIYILCHDGTGRTISILTQAGIRQQLRFPSPARTMQKADGWFDNGMFSPLILIRMKGGNPGVAEYKPVLSDSASFEMVQFPRWWETEGIWANLSGVKKNRKNIVFIVSNQDGGRHYDKEITDEEYWLLKTEGDPYFSYETGVEVEKGPYVRVNGAVLDLRDGKRVILRNEKRELKPILNAPSAIIRQIGWELDQAILGLGL